MHLATGADCTRWNNLALGWQDFSTASGLSPLATILSQANQEPSLASRHLAWDAYLANSKPSDKAMPTIVHNSAWFRAETWLMQSHVNSHCAKTGISMTRPALRQPINIHKLYTLGDLRLMLVQNGSFRWQLWTGSLSKHLKTFIALVCAKETKAPSCQEHGLWRDVSPLFQQQNYRLLLYYFLGGIWRWTAMALTLGIKVILPANFSSNIQINFLAENEPVQISDLKQSVMIKQMCRSRIKRLPITW